MLIIISMPGLVIMKSSKFAHEPLSWSSIQEVLYELDKVYELHIKMVHELLKNFGSGAWQVHLWFHRTAFGSFFIIKNYPNPVKSCIGIGVYRSVEL